MQDPTAINVSFWRFAVMPAASFWFLSIAGQNLNSCGAGELEGG